MTLLKVKVFNVNIQALFALESLLNSQTFKAHTYVGQLEISVHHSNRCVVLNRLNNLPEEKVGLIL